MRRDVGNQFARTGDDAQIGGIDDHAVSSHNTLRDSSVKPRGFGQHSALSRS
ncbi:MAG: hypothetical protein H0U76_11600 [Ktedonobacteraceae bacterium]|nr:hypothetical protein [Ktedonobacteraceae bacterium]